MYCIRIRYRAGAKSDSSRLAGVGGDVEAEQAAVPLYDNTETRTKYEGIRQLRRQWNEIVSELDGSGLSSRRYLAFYVLTRNSTLQATARRHHLTTACHDRDMTSMMDSEPMVVVLLALAKHHCVVPSRSSTLPRPKMAIFADAMVMRRTC